MGLDLDLHTTVASNYKGGPASDSCFLAPPKPPNRISAAHLQVFDGLFGHQLLLLVPLHRAHHTGPDHADHGLFREVGLLHLLLGVGDDLTRTGRWICGASTPVSCSRSAAEAYLLLGVAAGHHLLELLLQLLAGADGLLVAGEVGQLLQPRVSEVL